MVGPKAGIRRAATLGESLTAEGIDTSVSDLREGTAGIVMSDPEGARSWP